MNASSWSLRNLPWFKATLAQWRYALRNTIAMCLALTVAYYLNLDEPYWAMTSAAVVSFPTVGGVISKSLGRIAGSLLGAIAALLLAGHTLNEPWFFLLSMSAWLGFCTWACAHFTNNVAYAFQLAGYTAAIIAFPMVNITEASQLWGQRLRYFCRLYLQSSQELHRLQSGVDDHTRLPRTSGLARHTDNAEAMWSGLRTFCTLMMIGAWSIASQWDAGANALTLAAISCVLYSAVAAPFKSLSLLMRTLVLLSLFSFVVKFGLMVQISDLWQFLLFLFPLLATMQLLKLQMPKFAALWGQLIVFMGSFIAVTNPPVYDFADFLNDNLAKIVGVALAWLAFAILRPGSDARKSRRHIRALRRDFVDQLSRHPTLSESEFESLTYHHVSQLSNSQDALARRWLLRWGVVLLNCSHVVWQLRDWESRSDPLSRVRDNCISLLRGVMSERGVQQKSLAATLEELQRICDSLARHHQPAARELAAIVWRLYCSLSQLEQAPPQGTLAS
ncbi:TPA: FUSC family protein [Escherichia coli]|nr:FUSC family protein [Escherichia coli]